MCTVSKDSLKRQEAKPAWNWCVAVCSRPLTPCPPQRVRHSPAEKRRKFSSSSHGYLRPPLGKSRSLPKYLSRPPPPPSQPQEAKRERERVHTRLWVKPESIFPRRGPSCSSLGLFPRRRRGELTEPRRRKPQKVMDRSKTGLDARKGSLHCAVRIHRKP